MTELIQDPRFDWCQGCSQPIRYWVLTPPGKAPSRSYRPKPREGPARFRLCASCTAARFQNVKAYRRGSAP